MSDKMMDSIENMPKVKGKWVKKQGLSVHPDSVSQMCHDQAMTARLPSLVSVHLHCHFLSVAISLIFRESRCSVMKRCRFSEVPPTPTIRQRRPKSSPCSQASISVQDEASHHCVPPLCRSVRHRLCLWVPFVCLLLHFVVWPTFLRSKLQYLTNALQFWNGTHSSNSLYWIVVLILGCTIKNAV